MEWLNYHHLHYFWVVAKQGSIALASQELGLAHPTISAQIHQLEGVIGQKLFERKGRRLVLTEFGGVALRYADEIFTLGREFVDTAKGRSSGLPTRLTIGVSNVLSKSIVHRILEPAFRLEPAVRIICREDRSTEAFMGELAMHTVDLVLSDLPASAGSSVRVFSHPLGECGTALFASPMIARACRRGFPRSLAGKPFLRPSSNSELRRALNSWFDSLEIRPSIVAEVDDTALAKVLGEAGLGIFAAPDVVEKEVRQRYRAHLVGRLPELRQRFYAISVERKIRHPAVVAISEAARKYMPSRES